MSLRITLLVVLLTVPIVCLVVWKGLPSESAVFSSSSSANSAAGGASLLARRSPPTEPNDEPRSGGRAPVANVVAAQVDADSVTADDGPGSATGVSTSSRNVAVTVLIGTGNRLKQRNPSGTQATKPARDDEDDLDDDGGGMSGIVDGACVLRHTMLRYQPHDVSLAFIALVPVEEELDHWDAEALRVCGYRLQRVAAPIRVSEIQSSVLRQAILTRPVGLLELRKLASLNMTRFDAVLCIDADIMFVGPYDDLLLPPPGAWPWRMGKDCNGGLIVYYPQHDGPKHAAGVLDLLRRAAYSPKKGYAGTGFGADVDARRGLSGGPMLQGLLPYYTHAVLHRNPRDSRGAIAACRHNFYLAMPEFRVCYKYSLADVRSVHFKGEDLPKPWECVHTSKSQRRVSEAQHLCTQPACMAFMRRYHEEQWQMILRCTEALDRRQVKALSGQSDRVLLEPNSKPPAPRLRYTDIGCVNRTSVRRGSPTVRSVFVGLPTILRRNALNRG